LVSSSFTVTFIASLPMTVSGFEAVKLDYITAVASMAGVLNQAVEIVTLEPAAGATTAAGARRLLDVGVNIGTEVSVSSGTKAEAFAAALTPEALGPPLAAKGLPQPTSFPSVPRVVLGTTFVAAPSNSVSSVCELKLSWEDLVAVKVAERTVACASNASKQGGHDSTMKVGLA
jgi:hypothetical protein